MDDCPFWSPGSMIDCLNNWVISDGDNVLLITGEEGSGKSELGQTIALMIKPSMRPEKNIVFDVRDFQEVDEDLQIWDEAGNMAFNRNHQSRESKALVQMMMSDRLVNSTRILILPKKQFLDIYGRTHRVKIWIHCRAEYGLKGINRGYGDVYWREYFWDEQQQDFEARFVYQFTWDFDLLPESKGKKEYRELKSLAAQRTIAEAQTVFKL